MVKGNSEFLFSPKAGSGKSKSSTLQAKDDEEEKKEEEKEEKEKEEEEDDDDDMWITFHPTVEYCESYDGDCCLIGYHEKQPLKVLFAIGGTTHNFIDKSLVDKLGCESYPIKPRTAISGFERMVTSRACKNFQFSVQGMLFTVKLYLVPLSSDCEIVLGNQ